MNLVEVVLARCEAQPGAPALRDGLTRWTFGELGEQIQRRASIVARASRPGEIVHIADEGAQFAASYMAAMLAGRIASCGGNGSSEGASLAFADGEVSRLGGWPCEASSDGGVVLFTSGTTGRPKRVLHSLEGLAASLLNTVSIEQELVGGPPPNRSGGLAFLLASAPHGLGMLCAMPLESVAGLSMLNRSLAMGESIILPVDYGAPSLWAEMASSDVTNVGMPPIAAQRLLMSAKLNAWREPGLLSLGLGAARVDPAIAAGLERQFGCPVTAGYGSTELGGVALMSRPWDLPDQRWHSVGRPIGEVEVCLEPVEETTEELLVRTPAAMLGTLDEENRLLQAPGWIRTGDSAAWRTDGTIQIEGRIDYVILRGGRRVDPAFVEAALRAHPGVNVAAVLAQPSRIAGEQDVWGLVELHGSTSVTDVLHHCRENLESFQIPRQLVAVEAIPITTDGTPRRSELVKLLAEARQRGESL